MNYNPYFPGNAISMARVLFDGLVEYDDGECLTLIPLYPSDCDLHRHSRYDLSNGQGCRYFLELGR